MKNKLISWVLMLSISMSFSFSAIANNISTAEKDSTASIPSPINFNALEVVHGNLDDVTVVTAPEIEMQEISIEDLELSSEMDTVSPRTSGIDPENLPESTYRLGRSATNVFTDYLAIQGESKLLYPINVEAGSILQATLECPSDNSLDYDLYLYIFDMATGNLNPTPIDFSILTTYLKDKKTVDEGVGALNGTSATQYYCIEVYAKTGGSTSKPFKLTVSTDNSKYIDDSEPNESPYKAYALNAGYYVSGVSLNVENDRDWYAVTMPSNPDYAHLALSAPHIDSTQTALSTANDIALYFVNNNKMVKTSPESTTGNEQIYSISPGTYYICVSAKSGTFQPNSYRLNTSQKLTASRFTWDFVSDMDSPIQTGYPEGPGFWFSRKFSVEGVFSSASGYAVSGRRLDVKWTSEMWENVPEDHIRENHDYSGSNGRAIVDLSPPAEIGMHYASIGTYPGLQVTHRYAINHIFIAPQGLSGDAGNIYHFFISE